MKKRITAIVVTAVLVLTALCFVACESDREIPGYQSGKTNIVYYTWATEEEMAMFYKLIDAFEAKYPDIHVIMQKAADDYYGDLGLKLTGRNSPDIVQMKPGDIDEFLRSGAIISLQDYIDEAIAAGRMSEDMIWEYNDGYRYNPKTEIRGNHEDDIYSLIKDFSCDFVLNYNKKLVTDNMKTSSQYTYPKDSEGYPSTTQPMTWSQYMQFAGAMQTSGTNGAALDNEPYQQLLEWIQQGGGSLWSEDHKTVVDIKNTPAVRQAFDYYRMLRDEATNSPTFNAADTTLSTTQFSTKLSALSAVQVGPAQLKATQAATIFYGRWAYASYQTDCDKCETGFAAPPVPNGLEVTDTTKYAGITAMVGTSISAKSQNKDAAWKFIEFYFTEGQKMYAEEGFNIPGNKQIAANEFLTSDKLTAKEKETNQFFYDLALQHGFVIEFNKYLSQASVEDVLGAQLSQYFATSKKNGKFNNATWEATLDAIRTELQAKLDRATR